MLKYILVLSVLTLAVVVNGQAFCCGCQGKCTETPMGDPHFMNRPEDCDAHCTNMPDCAFWSFETHIMECSHYKTCDRPDSTNTDYIMGYVGCTGTD